MQILSDDEKVFTKNFLNASKPIRYIQQRSERESQKKVKKRELPPKLQQSINTLVCNSQLSKNGQSIIAIVKTADNTCRNVILLMLIIFCCLFCLDVRNQIIKQQKIKQTEKGVCYEDFLQNQCNSPVEILVQKCKELHNCAHEDAQKAVRVTQIIAQLWGRFFKVFVSSSQLNGAVIALTMIVIVLIFAYKNSKEVVIIKNQ